MWEDNKQNPEDIPFEVKLPGSQNYIDISKQSSKQSSKQKSLFPLSVKSGLVTAGAIVLTGVLTWLNFPSSNEPDTDYWKNMYEVSIPEGVNKSIPLKDSIKTITLGDTTHLAMHHDKFVSSLARKTDFVDLDNLIIDTNYMRVTRHAFEQVDPSEFIQLGNLGGMYVPYSDSGRGDLHNAMIDMCKKKISRKGFLHTKFFDDKISDYKNKKNVQSSSLNELKEMIDNEVLFMKTDFDYDKFFFDFTYDKRDTSRTKRNLEVERFMNMVYESLSSEQIFAFGQSEFFGSSNPVVSMVYLDKMIRFDKDIPWDVPAMFDNELSYGYPQLTPYVVSKDGFTALSLNKYLSKDNQVPESLEDFSKPEYHIRASLLNITFNALSLANRLAGFGELTDCNDMLEDFSDVKRDVFLSSIVASMNYKPSDVSKGVSNYMHQLSLGNVSPDGVFTDMYLGKATNYFKNCARNYVVAKNWDWAKKN